MKNHRKKSVAILAGLAITGIVGASAASLGGIAPNSLGAETEVVASCDTDGVAVSYTTSYNATDDEVQVDTVTISGVNAACDGLAYEVILTGDGTPRVVLGTSAPGTADASGSFSPAFAPGIDAELVTGIAITISD